MSSGRGRRSRHGTSRLRAEAVQRQRLALLQRLQRRHRQQLADALRLLRAADLPRVADVDVVEVAAAGVEEDHAPVRPERVPQRRGQVVRVVGGVLRAAHAVGVQAVNHGEDALRREVEDVDTRIDLADGADDVGVAAARVGADAAVLHQKAAVVGDRGLAADMQRHLLFRGGAAGGAHHARRDAVHRLPHPLFVDGALVETGVNLLRVGGEAVVARQQAAGVRVRAVNPDVARRRFGQAGDRRADAPNDGGAHADQVAGDQGDTLGVAPQVEHLGLQWVEGAGGQAVAEVAGHGAAQGWGDVHLIIRRLQRGNLCHVAPPGGITRRAHGGSENAVASSSEASPTDAQARDCFIDHTTPLAAPPRAPPRSLPPHTP